MKICGFTLEEFIPSVVQEVHKYLKIDIEAGFISPGEAINIFKGKGMDVEFQSKNGKTIMSSLNLLEPVSESKGELQFTGVKNSKKLSAFLFRLTFLTL